METFVQITQRTNLVYKFVPFVNRTSLAICFPVVRISADQILNKIANGTTQSLTEVSSGKFPSIFLITLNTVLLNFLSSYVSFKL